MNRKNVLFLAVMIFVCIMVFMPLPADAQKAAPKGAKAIFDSGDGASVRMSSASPTPSAPAPEKYVGISYKIALLKPNGDFSIVPKTRTFKSGERIKLLVRTNQGGYLSIMNIGPTGNTAVLFNEYVEGKQLYEIPKSTALMFVGTPGTEKIMIMLSGGPNPIVGRKPATVVDNPRGAPAPQQAPPVAPPSPDGSMNSSSQGVTPPPVPAADEGISQPPTPMMVSGVMHEFKDIVVEDHNKTGYAVISPKTDWKPSAAAKERIVLGNDTRDGSNYGVVPASAIADGGIFTLDFKLTHR